MDLPKLVRNFAIALVLVLLVVWGFITIRTAPPPGGYEACGPQPVTEASELKEEAHGCKTVAPIHSTAE